jgi:catechol 2,3-dioxygenase-like lactoylglutathione lyase family enzyme
VPILGVLETALYVDDLQAAEVFYVAVLGLEPESREPGRHVFLRCGDSMVLLFDPRTTSRTTGPVPAHGATGPGHIAFAVDDLDAWPGRLHDAAIEIEADIEWPGGGRSIYVRDPAGNSIELTTPEIRRNP